MSGELVVGVSGSPSDPSRTSTLVAATVARLAEEIEGARTETIEIGPLLADLGAASGRETMSDRTRRALETVEAADVLVVGSPAFRAAYSGAFKLFFDWVGQYDLVDTPVLLTATGAATGTPCSSSTRCARCSASSSPRRCRSGCSATSGTSPSARAATTSRASTSSSASTRPCGGRVPLIRGGFATAGLTDVRRPAEF